MNKKPTSIDGFIPRRAGSEMGEMHVARRRQPMATSRVTERTVHTGTNDSTERVGVARRNMVITARSDVDASLRSIDELPVEEGKKSRRQRRKDAKIQKPKSKTKRIIKWVAILLLAALLLVGGYLVFKTVFASGNVFKGNFLGILQHEPLKEDANGRSNFLILGTSEDDPGHEGADLTDSMMVLSLDQEKKNAYMFSIPRDLYVNYGGLACVSGYSGKINGYFSCVDDGETAEAEQNRLTKTRELVGGIVGMDIQYGIHVNYTVMRDVINAIGGSIDVVIKSRNPNGLMDSNFDWKCGKLAQRRVTCPPDGHYIQYPNGPATLDAEHALYLAQARGDRAPTYGFEQSNFDRERNQQMILVAIRDKAMSAGTLTNIGAVTGLIDALGNNLRTNVETNEIQTLMGLAKDIPADAITSLDFYTEDEPIFTTGNTSAGSSVYPVAGIGNYSELRAFIRKQILAEPYMKEEAKITVLNGSGVAGVAGDLAKKLEAKSFVINAIDNAPEGEYGKVKIYQLTTEKPFTAAKLKAMYGVELSTGRPDFSVVGETDFVIVIGDPALAE